MKKIRLSVMAIVAILAVSVAVVTKAHTFGKRQITACFKNVTLTNGSTTASLTNSSNIPAATADAAIIARPFISAANTPAAEGECDEVTLFCCLTVVETTNTSAPLINLGDGLKRYQVDRNFYKP